MVGELAGAVTVLHAAVTVLYMAVTILYMRGNQARIKVVGELEGGDPASLAVTVHRPAKRGQRRDLCPTGSCVGRKPCPAVS